MQSYFAKMKWIFLFICLCHLALGEVGKDIASIATTLTGTTSEAVTPPQTAMETGTSTEAVTTPQTAMETGTSTEAVTTPQTATAPKTNVSERQF